jgi:hypothetical protein
MMSQQGVMCECSVMGNVALSLCHSYLHSFHKHALGPRPSTLCLALPDTGATGIRRLWDGYHPLCTSPPGEGISGQIEHHMHRMGCGLKGQRKQRLKKGKEGAVGASSFGSGLRPLIFSIHALSWLPGASMAQSRSLSGVQCGVVWHSWS